MERMGFPAGPHFSVGLRSCCVGIIIVGVRRRHHYHRVGCVAVYFEQLARERRVIRYKRGQPSRSL